MGLFIGASILYLYEVSINFLQKLITKFKSRIGSSTKIEDMKTEYDEGQAEEMKITKTTWKSGL